ncbi:MAG: helix-turn-helix domain-containing protein [Methanoregulaceae archaeon]
MDDEVLILQPGDEQAQKIAKAMGSQTAGDILKILGEGDHSLTDITETLGIPLTTAKYHIGNLLDAGIIEIAETRYSVKGREVKIYQLSRKLVIVAPKLTSAREILLKYASLFGIVTVATLGIAVLAPFIRSFGEQPYYAPTVSAAAPATGEMALKMARDTNMVGSGVNEAVAGFPDAAALAFFFGGCLVIFLLLCYEIRHWRKLKK